MGGLAGLRWSRTPQNPPATYSARGGALIAVEITAHELINYGTRHTRRLQRVSRQKIRPRRQGGPGAGAAHGKSVRCETTAGTYRPSVLAISRGG